jgi:hypothetical protein
MFKAAPSKFFAGDFVEGPPSLYKKTIYDAGSEINISAATANTCLNIVPGI